jgi:hypothetical protein
MPGAEDSAARRAESGLTKYRNGHAAECEPPTAGRPSFANAAASP